MMTREEEIERLEDELTEVYIRLETENNYLSVLDEDTEDYDLALGEIYSLENQIVYLNSCIEELK